MREPGPKWCCGNACHRKPQQRRQVNKAQAQRRQAFLGHASDDVARSAGDGDRETDCRRRADGVMSFDIAVEHERNRQYRAAASHQAENDADYGSHKEYTGSTRQLPVGLGFNVDQSLGGGELDEHRKKQRQYGTR